ncbi:uncharacterized protein LOC111638280 isoform X2 [Centruroides sculpturatus]|uniref:uncharacterized protein LOC111638280 isoform X2 n=1 Tax=Centruroides sculpturatus TaxID=218467 RepID=UPI000C6ED3EC|nr:uncharacterized protein LOC111638280 isoform X2 [Centruroides sculpturatus]
MIMTPLVVLISVVSSITCREIWNEGNDHHPFVADMIVARYCALKDRARARYCSLENHFVLINEFHKNCVQQVKFFQTFEEINAFICNRKHSLEYAKYIKCFRAAMSALSQDSPSTIPKTLFILFF